MYLKNANRVNIKAGLSAEMILKLNFLGVKCDETSIFIVTINGGRFICRIYTLSKNIDINLLNVMWSLK